MDTEFISRLTSKIKEKKELSGLADSVVEDELMKYIKKYSINLSDIKPSDEKIIIKDLRASLRNLMGRFQRVNKREPASDFMALLKTHSSTSERIEFYPELKRLISSLRPSSILDLGCGLNPLAIAEPSIKYYASDIDEGALNLVRHFFNEKNIVGKTFVYDLRKIDDSLPEADLCLIFKVLDIIESKGHKLAEKIITSVHCKWVLVSFSTKKLSGKPMTSPSRPWFESMLSRLGFGFKKIKTHNEVFYLIEKTNPR